MESLGVIQRVQESSQWVNSMVIVEKKSGKLRICLDLHDLNKNVQCPHYPIKTNDDVLPQLKSRQIFHAIGHYICILEHHVR